MEFYFFYLTSPKLKPHKQMKFCVIRMTPLAAVDHATVKGIQSAIFYTSI